MSHRDPFPNLNMQRSVLTFLRRYSIALLMVLYKCRITTSLHKEVQVGTSRQRSGKGAIRKRLPLQKPRWKKKTN